MKDIQMGRKLAVSAVQIPIPIAAPLTVVPPDPNRTRLVFSSDGVTPIWVWPNSMGRTTASGFALVAQSPQMTVTVEVWGKLVGDAWSADDGGARSVLSVVQSTLEEQ